ncbi:Coiled-coil domain-containing protein [Senna tora]|uniref:Coiled-coil domain-containing protein n=1 Tax=Senna tora TaxID=362788 RepID=A0A834W782_9FABA|nr:Coiled-coil domain-containing protein [Senna tora]
MSGMVEIWVGEIAKLGEKVLSHKPKKVSSSSSSQTQQSHPQIKQNTDTTTTMSEATVCLLMDRFVPC